MDATDLSLLEETPGNEGPTAAEIDEVEQEEEEEEAAFVRSVCREVKLISGVAPTIHLGIGDGAVDLIVRLGGTPDISVYEDATAIEGATLTLGGVELRAQRIHRTATPDEVELLRQARRPTLRIFPSGKPNEG